MPVTLRRRRLDGLAVCEEEGSAGKRPRLRLNPSELNTALQLIFDKCLNIVDLLRVETVNRDWRSLALRSLRLQKKVDLKKLFLPQKRREKERQRFCSMLEWLWQHCPNVRQLMQLSEVLPYLSGSCQSHRTVFTWSSRIGRVISRFTKLDNFRIALQDSCCCFSSVLPYCCNHYPLQPVDVWRLVAEIGPSLQHLAIEGVVTSTQLTRPDYQSAYKHARFQCDVAGALGKATRLESVELKFPNVKSVNDILAALKTDRLVRVHLDVGSMMRLWDTRGSELREFNDRLRAFLLACPVIETVVFRATLYNWDAFALNVLALKVQELSCSVRAAVLAAKPGIQIIIERYG